MMDLIPDTKKAKIQKEGVRHFTVMAMESCEILCLSLENLADLKEKYPSVVKELF